MQTACETGDPVRRLLTFQSAVLAERLESRGDASLTRNCSRRSLSETPSPVTYSSLDFANTHSSGTCKNGGE